MEVKAKFLRVFLLQKELEYFHNSLENHEEFLELLRLIRQNFICLNTFRESLSLFNNYIKVEDDLKYLTKDLRKRLELVNHIRNKVAGHLDEELLKRAAQWEPHIFSEVVATNEDFQSILVYKTIIESAINSFIDENNNDTQKYFKTEIDLNYPPNRKLFLNYLRQLNTDSIKWLKQIKSLLEQDFKYTNLQESFEFSKIAGQTDFNLKKEQTISNEYSEFSKKFIEKIKDIYFDDNSKTSIPKLEKLILELERVIEKRKKD